MSDVRCDETLCERCETLDCLVRCPFLGLELDAARAEWDRVCGGEDSRVLRDCLTCYACEEYCPHDNHPFYRIVEQQEALGVQPAPAPVTQQQIAMMAPKGKVETPALEPPVIDMCVFPQLLGSIRGSLFEGCSTIVGRDLFCNIMWLHFARSSVIRERLPGVIDNLQRHYLGPNGIDELICFHDECYAAFTHLAPAFGIEVPFKPVHVFEFLLQRLDALQGRIRPMGLTVAYQRPCSSRLIGETHGWVAEIFDRIGVRYPERTYDGEDALCCASALRAQQRDELADELQARNLADMKQAGAHVCVFNCPVCLLTLHEPVAEAGLMPMPLVELCHVALGEGKLMGGGGR